tara:strand:+ start:377 stop:1222 length:846 start_codon:yes stop_codon:yes gene_type:complete
MSNKTKCSPGTKYDNVSCYTKDDLICIIKIYNENNSNNKIVIKNIENTSKKVLWNKLDKKFKKVCDNERCWIENNFTNSNKKNELQKRFIPKMPSSWKKNKYEWLSNYDIKHVMEQYHNKYSDFIFMGPFPVDCPEEITCPLTNLSPEILINRMGKTKFATIYNLDKHNQPGSHWVAVYIDLKKCEVYYFDSVGKNPPRLIHDFLVKFAKKCSSYHKDFLGKYKPYHIYVNNTQFQFGHSECGIFSIYFILSCLKNKTFESFTTNKVNDEKMNELRKAYYD